MGYGIQHFLQIQILDNALLQFGNNTAIQDFLDCRGGLAHLRQSIQKVEQTMIGERTDELAGRRGFEMVALQEVQQRVFLRRFVTACQERKPVV